MHWSKCFESKDPVFSDCGDRYGFYGMAELAIEIIEQNGGDLEPEDLPKRFFKCNQTLLSTEVDEISLRLFEGTCSATIVEGLIEDLYCISDLEYPNYCDLDGLKELEISFSAFTTLNYFLWKGCCDIESFNPGVQSIGIKKLQTAIDKFSEDNKSIGIWDHDYKKPIELDEYFWRFKVFPHTKVLPASDRA